MIQINVLDLFKLNPALYIDYITIYESERKKVTHESDLSLQHIRERTGKKLF